jgi:hypothetical protein
MKGANLTFNFAPQTCFHVGHPGKRRAPLSSPRQKSYRAHHALGIAFFDSLCASCAQAARSSHSNFA